MRRKKIKLIIIDFYGVLTFGSYRDTCRWLSKKYKLPFNYVHKVFYYKYFMKAVVGKISERKSFELPIQELGLGVNWKDLRKKHLSFQKLNKKVFNLCLKMQTKGYTICILSMNTKSQFNEILEKYKIKRYFKNVINTFDLKLPKASPKTIKFILKKFKVKPTQTLMIDDQDFNLVVAKKIGVKTILYKDFKRFNNMIEKYIKFF